MIVVNTGYSTFRAYSSGDDPKVRHDSVSLELLCCSIGLNFKINFKQSNY